MSWIITGKEAGSLGLLDQYGGAAAAYSLRKLSVYYTGPVIRVRRSSDNAEQDFTDTQITDGTLTTFCGAGDGFVRTWYDQSGNSNNAIQLSAASQPKCVSGGLLVQDNSKPAFLFDGIDDQLGFPVITSILGTNPRYFASVINPANANERGFLVWDTSALGGAVSIATNNNIVTFRFTAGRQDLGTSTVNDQNLISWSLPEPANNANLSSVGCNGVYTPLTLNRTLDTELVEGSIGGDYASLNIWFLGKIQEIVLYGSDQSTNRTAIESNINSHYGIF